MKRREYIIGYVLFCAWLAFRVILFHNQSPDYRYIDGVDAKLFQNGIHYLDGPDQDPVALAARPKDFLTLDLDPTGRQTAAYGATHGLPWDTGTLAVINVFGRPMNRDKLAATEDGRELLSIVEEQRSGHKRDFFDAIREWQISDAPLGGIVASILGSIDAAAEVSETFRKLQNGEGVSDSELVHTRLYMAKNERNSNGTWGAIVGDVVRQVPSALMEWLALLLPISLLIGECLRVLVIKMRKRLIPLSCPSLEQVPSTSKASKIGRGTLIYRAFGVVAFVALFMLGTYLARMTDQVLAGYIVGAAAFAVVGGIVES